MASTSGQPAIVRDLDDKLLNIYLWGKTKHANVMHTRVKKRQRSAAAVAAAATSVKDKRKKKKGKKKKMKKGGGIAAYGESLFQGVRRGIWERQEASSSTSSDADISEADSDVTVTNTPLEAALDGVVTRFWARYWTMLHSSLAGKKESLAEEDSRGYGTGEDRGSDGAQAGATVHASLEKVCLVASIMVELQQTQLDAIELDRALARQQEHAAVSLQSPDSERAVAERSQATAKGLATVLVHVGRALQPLYDGAVFSATERTALKNKDQKKVSTREKSAKREIGKKNKKRKRKKEKSIPSSPPTSDRDPRQQQRRIRDELLFSSIFAMLDDRLMFLSYKGRMRLRKVVPQLFDGDACVQTMPVCHRNGNGTEAEDTLPSLLMLTHACGRAALAVQIDPILRMVLGDAISAIFLAARGQVIVALRSRWGADLLTFSTATSAASSPSCHPSQRLTDTVPVDSIHDAQVQLDDTIPSDTCGGNDAETRQKEPLENIILATAGAADLQGASEVLESQLEQRNHETAFTVERVTVGQSASSEGDVAYKVGDDVRSASAAFSDDGSVAVVECDEGEGNRLDKREEVMNEAGGSCGGKTKDDDVLPPPRMLPKEWLVFSDSAGREYFYNSVTKDTRLEWPVPS